MTFHISCYEIGVNEDMSKCLFLDSLKRHCLRMEGYDPTTGGYDNSISAGPYGNLLVATDQIVWM